MGNGLGEKELQGMPGGEGKKRLQESILSCKSGSIKSFVQKQQKNGKTAY